MILHQVDPLFKKTTQRFDEMSLSTLMSSTLDLSSNLQLQLDSFLSSEGKLKDFETNLSQSGQNKESTENAV